MKLLPAHLAGPVVRAQAVCFLLGLGAGLVALGAAGWQAARTDYHPGFVRFVPALSPETSYYPSLNEMTAIVRARCRPDQVLVIVGGNSILQGVWQPAAEVWSAHLQALLGDRYCVLNFAMRGALPTDGGAVVAEALRHDYPRQIYIADEAPFGADSPMGHEPYRYLYWQAYFRGLLIPTPERRAGLDELLSSPETRPAVVERALATYADCALHFEDLWNRLAFTTVNTVPSYLGEYFPPLLTPRRKYPDQEPDATDPAFQAARYPAAGLETELGIIRNVTGLYYVRTPGGQWRMPHFHQRDLAAIAAAAFPPALHARTLMLVSRSSPFYRRRLNAAELEREDLGFRDAVAAWQAAGYAALEYGRDYTDDDFGDRSHLSKSGGRKLAESVAPAVAALARQLGYRP